MWMDEKLSTAGSKIKVMIDDGRVDKNTMKNHIRLSRVNKIINQDEEQHLCELLQRQ